MLVTDRGSANLSFIDRIVSYLNRAEIACAVFSDISPNPTDIEATSGKAFFEQGEFDSVIAVGGGSAMDGGKAISLIAGNQIPLWQFDFDLEPPVASQFVPLICIPTTAGTGAETESTAMLTNTKLGIKGCVHHPAHRPVAAILDPELTINLPANLTAWTGCDAMVHSIEAYCVDTWHPLCDGAALEALRLISGSLQVAVNQPHDLSARGNMLVGSCLAGISFLKGLGLVHGISHMVGAVYNTHHGLTNAVLLPPVLLFNRDAIEPRIKPMCEAMNIAGHTFDDFYGYICNALDRLEIPRSLAELGVGNERITELAQKSSGDAATLTNPRAATIEDITAIISQAVIRAR